MLPNKIKTNDEILYTIVNKRKQLGYTAAQLSVKCGKSVAWLTSVENKRASTITAEDAIKLFSILYNSSREAAEKKLESILDLQAHLDQLDNPYPRYEEYEKSCEDFANHPKELYSKIKQCNQVLSNMLKQIDFKNADSLLSNETILNTVIQLLTTDEGLSVLRILGKYPLHKLDKKDLKKIVNILQEDLVFEYTVDSYNDIPVDIDSENSLPRLRCEWKSEYNDLFE